MSGRQLIGATMVGSSALTLLSSGSRKAAIQKAVKENPARAAEFVYIDFGLGVSSTVFGLWGLWLLLADRPS